MLGVLDELDVERSGSMTRAVVRLDAVGLTSQFEPVPLVRSSAPDSLGEYLDARRRRGIERLGVLTGPSGLIGRTGVPLRVRLRHAAYVIPALASIQYLTLTAVLVATIVSGRLPLDATPAVLAVTWLPAALLGVAARRSLARGTMAWGDWTRQTWRTLGADVAALYATVARAHTRRRGDAPVSGIAALTQMRALGLAVVVIDLALLIRGTTLLSPDLLPRFDAHGPYVLIAAFLTLVPMVDVLQLVVRRKQRRRQYRLPVDHDARVDGRSVRMLDMTTLGIGVLADAPIAVGQLVDVELELPDVDRSSQLLRLRAVVTSTTDHPAASSRLGMKFVDLDDVTRRQVTAYCMLTHHVLAAESDTYDSADDVFTAFPSPARSRLGLAQLTAAAVLVCGTTIVFGPGSGPASAAPDSPVSVCLLTSTGDPLAGATVTYNAGAWTGLDPTGLDGCSHGMVPAGLIRFRVTHDGLTTEVRHDASLQPRLEFTTSLVTVRFELSDGSPVAGVPVVFAGSRWATFGTTGANGEVTRELLESSRLRVRVTHENLTVEQSQNTATDPMFTFTTSPVTVRFELSDGSPVAGVPVIFAGSRWATFGTTGADGTVTREFLESSRLRVRATHENLTVEQSQDTATDPMFTFTTSPVTVRFELSDGSPVAGVPVIFAGSRWATFGTTGANGR